MTSIALVIHSLDLNPYEEPRVCTYLSIFREL